MQAPKQERQAAQAVNPKTATANTVQSFEDKRESTQQLLQLKAMMHEHSPNFSSKDPIQLMTIPTLHGAFKTVKFEKVAPYKKDVYSGVYIDLEFHPGSNVNATKIGLSQAIKTVHEEDTLDDSPHKRKITSDDGYHIDQFDQSQSPVYQVDADEDVSSLSEGGATTGNQFGRRVPSDDNIIPAKLIDRPNSTYSEGRKTRVEFETTAIAMSGVQAGEYYGSINWGYSVDDKDAKTIGPDLASLGTPSKKFMDAAAKWNQVGRALGTWTTNRQTSLHEGDKDLTFIKNLPQGTVVTGHGEYTIKGKSYNRVTGTTGLLFKTAFDGLVLSQDLTEANDGNATAALPLNYNQKFEVVNPIQLFKSPSMDEEAFTLQANEVFKINYDKSSVVFGIFYFSGITSPKMGYGYLNKNDIKPQ